MPERGQNKSQRGPNRPHLQGPLSWHWRKKASDSPLYLSRPLRVWSTVTAIGVQVWQRWGGERPFQEERIGREMNLLSHMSQVFLFIQSTFQFFSSHITLLDYQNCTSYSLTIHLGHCNFMHICLMVGHLENQTRFFPFTFYDSLCRQGLFTDLTHNRKRPCVVGKLANRPSALPGTIIPTHDGTIWYHQIWIHEAQNLSAFKF